MSIDKKDDGSKVTKFLALDKCALGRNRGKEKRQFLQIIEVAHDESLPIRLDYDLEWLAILFLTNHLLSVKNVRCYMPSEVYSPTRDQKEAINRKFNYDLTVPLNFKQSVKPYNPAAANVPVSPPNLVKNDQTTEFSNKLVIGNPFVLLRSTARVAAVNKTYKSGAASFSSSTPVKQKDFFTDVPCCSKEGSFTDVSYSSKENGTPLFIVDCSPSYNLILPMTPLKPPAVEHCPRSFDSVQDTASPGGLYRTVEFLLKLFVFILL